MKPTQFLVSVRSVPEALEVESLADWIDLKEPRFGSLGAVASSDAAAICKRLASPARRCPANLSAAAGELRDWPRSPARRLLSVDGLNVLKLGLAGCSFRANWRRLWSVAAQEVAAAGKQLAAVAYADHRTAAAPPPEEVAELAIAASASHLLVDTWDKAAGSLLDHMPINALDRLLSRAKADGLRTIAAGSLGLADLSRLPLETIDMIAVRGAVCPAGRSGSVARDAVESFRRELAAASGANRCVM